MSRKLVTMNPSAESPQQSALSGQRGDRKPGKAHSHTAHCVFIAILMSAGCGGVAKQHAKFQKIGESFRLDLAELYVDKGARKAAVPLLKKVLSDQPKNIKARVLYGCVLRDLGLHPQAERHLLFALRLSPRYAGVHASMGILRDLQRRHAEAIKYHVTAVRLAPRNAGYRNNLGFSLYLAGKLDSAIRHLERALAMDPGLMIAYNNLGFAYGKKRRYELAQRTFRAALGESSTLLNMALIYERTGDARKAVELRERAYALNPDLRPIAEHK